MCLAAVCSAYVGATAINLGGSDAQKQHWLPKIVDGSEILTLAVDEQSRHQRDRVESTAQATGDGFTINGAKTFVLEGMSATALIVAARTEEESVGLFLVPADAQGLSRQAMHTLDSRDYARVTLSSVSVSSEAYLGAMPAGELHEAVLNSCRRHSYGDAWRGLLQL